MFSSENKIDQIDARLADIESLLRSNLRASNPDTRQALRQDNSSVIRDPAGSLSRTNQDEMAAGEPTPYSGFTGPGADSILAHEVVEQTLGSSPHILKDERLVTALRSLQQIVGKMKTGAAEPSLKPLSAIVSREPVIPHWDDVSALLEKAQCKSLSRMTLRCPHRLIHMLQRIALPHSY